METWRQILAMMGTREAIRREAIGDITPVARDSSHAGGHRRPRGWHQKLRARRKAKRAARRAQRRR